MISGLGTELVAVEEMRRSLEPPGADGRPRDVVADLRDCFTEAERATCLARVDPAPGLAARLAAKRAALAALGHPEGCERGHVEIVRQPSGKPELRLHGPARTAASALGVTAMHVTLTHLDDHALAVVLLEAAP